MYLISTNDLSEVFRMVRIVGVGTLIGVLFTLWDQKSMIPNIVRNWVQLKDTRASFLFIAAYGGLVSLTFTSLIAWKAFPWPPKPLFVLAVLGSTIVGTIAVLVINWVAFRKASIAII